MALYSKAVQHVRNWFRQKNNLLTLLLAVLGAITVLFYTAMNNNDQLVDVSSLRPLMKVIADAESNGNYNAYFGNAANTSIDFTTMSVEDVQGWQAEFIKDGSPSSAVGRYQIINTTLDGLISELDIDETQAFDAALQDTLSVALIHRRGAKQYVNGELSDKQFAANLAKEWAALPKVTGNNPSESYYASDGLNQSSVSIQTILKAVLTVKPIE